MLRPDNLNPRTPEIHHPDGDLSGEPDAKSTLSAVGPGKDDVMNSRILSGWTVGLLLAVAGQAGGTGAAQTLAKGQVANLIAKVENGVDQFRDYLKNRGDNARDAASTPQAQSRRSSRRTASDSTKVAATATKDELDDALSDLNRSTNRLRRKFDATDKWMETRVEVERVLDDARKMNQTVARGNYGSQAAKLWATLRAGINDLARAYGLQPLAV